jgi:hypothetical protein
LIFARPSALRRVDARSANESLEFVARCGPAPFKRRVVGSQQTGLRQRSAHISRGICYNGFKQ